VDKNLIEDRIGTYNRKFAKLYKPSFDKILGPGGSKLNQLTDNKIQEVFDKFNEKVSEGIGRLGQGPDKLLVYSEWLHELDSNDFFN
jgi:hypothetical protein